MNEPRSRARTSASNGDGGGLSVQYGGDTVVAPVYGKRTKKSARSSSSSSGFRGKKNGKHGNGISFASRRRFFIGITFLFVSALAAFAYLFIKYEFSMNSVQSQYDTPPRVPRGKEPPSMSHNGRMDIPDPRRKAREDLEKRRRMEDEEFIERRREHRRRSAEHNGHDDEMQNRRNEMEEVRRAMLENRKKRVQEMEERDSPDEMEYRRKRMEEMKKHLNKHRSDEKKGKDVDNGKKSREVPDKKLNENEERKKDIMKGKMMSVMGEVALIVRENKVVIFSKSTCPHCGAAKDLLHSLMPNDAAPVVVELDHKDDPDVWIAVLDQLTGQRTVPNIFVDGDHVGTNDKIQKLHQDGKLKKLLGLE